MTDAAPAPPDLLAHAAFVRRLVRSLLSDAHAAADVEQETWRAALERPPRLGGDTRGWLARVARNFAWRRARGEVRRGERERAGARPEALPAAEAGLERTETLQRVVDAVRALEEPYRATILARYYEDLPPRAIAAREGCAVATVHTRLKRGLARLRVRLAREGTGALSLFAGESPCLPPHADESVVLRPTHVMGLVGAAAAIAAAWTLWRVVEPAPARPAPRAVRVTGRPAPSAPAEPAATGGREPAASAATAATAEVTPESPVRSAPESVALPVPDSGVVRGQVVDERGAPIADALVFFGEESRARGDEPFKPLRFERIEDGARSGGDGGFELRGDGAQVTAVHTDFSGTTVAVAEAGRIVLGPRGAIQGRLLGSDGRPAAGTFVLLDGPSDDPARAPQALTDGNGWFRFDGVEAGAHALWREAGNEQGEILVCARVSCGAEVELEVRGGAPLELDGPALTPEELTALEGVVVGLDEVFGACWIEDGIVHGTALPGRYWLATRGGLCAPALVAEGDSRTRVELGGALLSVRSARRTNVQVVPAEADPFTRLMAARAWVKAEGESAARFRLHPGRYLLVGHAGTVLRELELPPEGLALTLE